MVYEHFKDLTRRVASDKILCNKAFNIVKNPKGLTLMVYKFLIKKKTSGGAVKNENISIQEFAEELHKLIIRKFEKQKVYPSFLGNIWDAGLADMQLISKFNEGILFILCAIDVFSKYALVIPLKNKKGITITNAFQKILDESNRKPNKTWVDQGSEFYNR